MKLAVLSESPADEAALRILVDAILGAETEPIFRPALRARGWPAIKNLLPSVVKHLHYRTEAEALVVLVDSDDSPVHEPAHEEPGKAYATCRLCDVRLAIEEVLSNLPPVPGRAESLRVAVGLACPCIEAWYQCGRDPSASERNWKETIGTGARGRDARRQLKKAVYGTDRPALPLETQRAKEEARRLTGDLGMLEKHFPGGFGALVRDIRGWSVSAKPAP